MPQQWQQQKREEQMHTHLHDRIYFGTRPSEAEVREMNILWIWDEYMEMAKREKVLLQEWLTELLMDDVELFGA